MRFFPLHLVTENPVESRASGGISVPANNTNNHRKNSLSLYIRTQDFWCIVIEVVRSFATFPLR